MTRSKSSASLGKLRTPLPRNQDAKNPECQANQGLHGGGGKYAFVKLMKNIFIIFTFFILCSFAVSWGQDALPQDVFRKMTPLEVLNDLNIECKRDGIPEFTQDRLTLVILKGISVLIDPLPESDWDGKLMSFVLDFGKKDNKLILPVKIDSMEDSAIKFTDEKIQKEFFVKLPRFKIVSLRIYDPSVVGGKINWIDIPIYSISKK